MARKSRAAPPTIAQLQKLEAAHEAKSNAYLASSRRLAEYKERVAELGTGYTETVGDEVYVVSMVKEYAYADPKLHIIKANVPVANKPKKK